MLISNPSLLSLSPFHRDQITQPYHSLSTTVLLRFITTSSDFLTNKGEFLNIEAAYVENINVVKGSESKDSIEFDRDLGEEKVDWYVGVGGSGSSSDGIMGRCAVSIFAGFGLRCGGEGDW